MGHRKCLFFISLICIWLSGFHSPHVFAFFESEKPQEKEIQEILELAETNPKEFIARLHKIQEIRPQMEILTELGEKKDKDFVPLLIELFQQDTDFYIRQRAGYILAELKDVRAVPALIEILQKDPFPFVRSVAVYALAQINGEQALLALLEALHKDSQSTVRFAALQNLAWFNDERAMLAFVEVLQKNSNSEYRLVAAESLRGFNDERATSALSEACIKDSEEDVRRAAIIVLASFGNQKFFPAFLRACLHDPNKTIRRKAALFLEKSRFDSVNQSLESLSPEEQRELIHIFSENGAVVLSNHLRAKFDISEWNNKNLKFENISEEDRKRLVEDFHFLRGLRSSDALFISSYLMKSPSKVLTRDDFERWGDSSILLLKQILSEAQETHKMVPVFLAEELGAWAMTNEKALEELILHSPSVDGFELLSQAGLTSSSNLQAFLKNAENFHSESREIDQEFVKMVLKLLARLEMAVLRSPKELIKVKQLSLALYRDEKRSLGFEEIFAQIFSMLIVALPSDDPDREAIQNYRKECQEILSDKRSSK